MMIQAVGNKTISSNFGISGLLNKDMFLDLLVKELTYQDPMEPMNSRDFITQLAQFSSLKQLNNLDSKITEALKIQMLHQGAQMIGYIVEGVDPLTEEKVNGEVKQVYLKEGTVYLMVGDKKIPLSSITNILSK